MTAQVFEKLSCIRTPKAVLDWHGFAGTPSYSSSRRALHERGLRVKSIRLMELEPLEFFAKIGEDVKCGRNELLLFQQGAGVLSCFVHCQNFKVKLKKKVASSDFTTKFRRS